MNILVVGMNHKTAPVEIREQMAFAESELDEALQALRNQKSIFETVIVSTCNRTELYVVSDQIHTGRYYTKAFLANHFNMKMDDMAQYIFVKENEDAVRHLFNVVCGLDSLVLGETQILGQVRDAFIKAQGLGVTGTFFNELFKEALTVAKRAHSETMINDNAVSVSYAAVELANKIFGDLSDKHILVLGAGKMGELTATHLKSHGASKITVMNRTYEKAVELAERFAGQAKGIEHLDQALNQADILISSTGSKNFVITEAAVRQAVKQRKGKPLFIVDIAVPRDVEPAINEIESVFLYDIDDLEDIVQTNLAERKEAAEQIAGMIEVQVAQFTEWVSTLGVVPVIAALRQKALNIQSETMKSIERKMPDLTDRERKIISKHTKSIVNQLLRDPIQRAKEFATAPNADELLEAFIQIFSLENDLRDRVEVSQISNEKGATSRPILNGASTRS
ncbi:MAG: glutamyl-tRNA reductase [Tuberibacillus sp.]